MKVRKIVEGDLIEVGDRIKVDTALGTQWQEVTRVTAKYAFVRYNDVAEGKYKRRYDGFGFQPIPRQQWITNQYSAWRPISQSSAAEPDERK